MESCMQFASPAVPALAPDLKDFTRPAHFSPCLEHTGSVTSTSSQPHLFQILEREELEHSVNRTVPSPPRVNGIS